MDIIIIILLALVIVLLTAVFIRLMKKNTAAAPVTDEKIENLRKMTAEGFTSLRQDTAQSNAQARRELSEALEKLGSKTEALSEKISDSSLNTVRTLSGMQEKIDGATKEQTRALTTAVEKLQSSNEVKLEQMRQTVDEKLTATLTTRLDSSFKSVSEQLSNVYKSLGEMKELSGGINALNRVFTNVKTRGNWAETQLEGILDSIIPGMYIKNFRPAENRDVVEFAVIIPDADTDKKTYLPIDSKFPMEDYLRLLDAADEGDTEKVKAYRHMLEMKVVSEARTIAKYICPPVTTPFAVMYLATDSLYAEVISSKENVADRLHSEFGILLAGPSTITALLSSLSMGFRTVALNRKANEVMEILSAAKMQYDKFGVALDKAKRKLDEAALSIDEAQKRNTIISKKLKGVESIDTATADGLLGTDE